MKHAKIYFLLSLSLCFLGCRNKVPIVKYITPDNGVESIQDNDFSLNSAAMKRDLLCLMLAYPQYISGIDENEYGSVYIIMKSGKKIIYDDKRIKSHDGKIANSDIQDMLEQVYPICDIKELKAVDFDPGRARVYSLLKDVYGSSEAQVRSNLTNVKTTNGSFMFNKNNNAAQSLKEALNEAAALAKNNRRILAALYPSSGTFNYRNISGTGLLSPHSFGIAIDLARDKRDYWQWASRKEGQERLTSYPREIVTVFEKHNFIWGGKWGHFDILHFEYRPEIMYKSRFFSSSQDTDQPWYKGAPYDDLEVKKYIDIIEQVLNKD